MYGIQNMFILRGFSTEIVLFLPKSDYLGQKGSFGQILDPTLASFGIGVSVKNCFGRTLHASKVNDEVNLSTLVPGRSGRSGREGVFHPWEDNVADRFKSRGRGAHGEAEEVRGALRAAVQHGQDGSQDTEAPKAQCCQILTLMPHWTRFCRAYCVESVSCI